MKRTRSGCHTCRQRRVKCDETRPVCNNCSRRSLLCNFELRYRWIREVFLNNTESDSPSEQEIKDNDGEGDADRFPPSVSPGLGDFTRNESLPSGPEVSPARPPAKAKGRKGPTSTKRKIGQEAVNYQQFSAESLRNLDTVMEEESWDSDEDMPSIPRSIRNGDMALFKKFKIAKKEDDPDFPDRLSNPILLHSPLFRSYTVGDQALSAIEDSMLPPPLYSRDDPPPTSSIETSAENARPQFPKLHSNEIAADHGPSNVIIASSGPPAIANEDQYGADPYSVHNALYSYLLEGQSLPHSYSQHMENPLSVYVNALKRPRETDSDPPPSLELFDSFVNESTGLLADHTEHDLFMYFVNTVADDLVPIPFEESPYYKHIPIKAESDRQTYNLLVAFGASHKINSTTQSDLVTKEDTLLVDWLLERSEKELELSLSSTPRSNSSLLGATMLAIIELDRGSAKRWWYYLDVALHVIRLRPTFADWELDNEINSMLFRLVGFMVSIANLLCGPAPRILPFPSWPQWSGSLDHLTGIDLNLLPLFSEVSFLSRSCDTQVAKALQSSLAPEASRAERVFEAMKSTTALQRIRIRALRIFQRLNDYWIEEYIPDSDITAMCILFQEALQIHLLRRVLKFPAHHPVVQRIITLGMRHLEQWISPQSQIQRNMVFILATLASEAIQLRHRTVLIIRMRNMAETGVKYYWKLIRDLKYHWEIKESLICSRNYTLLPR